MITSFPFRTLVLQRFGPYYTQNRIEKRHCLLYRQVYATAIGKPGTLLMIHPIRQWRHTIHVFSNRDF